MAGHLKLRVLVLGAEHFATAKVQAALAASDWAMPITLSRDEDALSDRHLDGIDAIFNGTAGKPATIAATARQLYGALERTGAEMRVIQLSSMTVYGSLQGEALESAPLRADLGPYGEAQIRGEEFARKYPRSVILRPGCEYGPDSPEWTVRIARLLEARRLGDLGAAGDGVCNLLFVDDLIAAVSASLRAPGIEGHAFNLAMRSPPTWNEYFIRFAQALGAVPVTRVGARRLRAEAKVLAPVLRGLEMIERRLRGASSPATSRWCPPALTASLLALCGQDIALNVGKAERELGMVWTPLDAGLHMAAQPFFNGHPMGSTSMRRNSIG
jgi:nucleoside-diphosphate-sugar epimerase